MLQSWYTSTHSRRPPSSVVAASQTEQIMTKKRSNETHERDQFELAVSLHLVCVLSLEPAVAGLLVLLRHAVQHNNRALPQPDVSARRRSVMVLQLTSTASAIASLFSAPLLRTANESAAGKENHIALPFIISSCTRQQQRRGQISTQASSINGEPSRRTTSCTCAAAALR